MSKPVDTVPYPIPLPLQGLNTVYPNVDLTSGYARELTNYSLVNGRLRMRPAVRSQVRQAAAGVHIHWFSFSTNFYAVDIGDNEIINMTDGSNGLGDTGGTHVNAHTAFHADTLYVFGCEEPRQAEYPFTAWTFTTGTLTATAILTGVSHKGRMYVAGGGAGNGAIYEYSALGAVTGAMAADVDLTALFNGQSIHRMFSISIAQGLQTENVLVFCGDGGKILVYEGDYPGATDWRVVGNFDMPAPISNVGYVEVDGDVLVCTGRYCYWLRDLFAGGAQTAYRQSPSRPVESLWQSLFWDSDPASPEVSHAFYIDAIDGIALDCIVVQCSEKNTYAQLSSVADYGNEACCLVYFRKYNAWSLWFTTPFYTPVRKVGTGYYGVGLTFEIVKFDSTRIVDEKDGGGPSGANDYAIISTWKTPYFNPFSKQTTRLVGTRPFYRNSFSGYFHLNRVIADYSDYNAPFGFYDTSGALETPLTFNDGTVNLPPVTYDHYSPLINVGIYGFDISLQYTQTRQLGHNPVQTHEIFAVVAYLQRGGLL